MIIFIFIGILLVLGFIVLRFAHIEKKLRLVILVILGLLLYFSVVSLFATESVDLTSPRGIVGAVYVYFGWLGRTIGKLWEVGKETTGKVIEAVSSNMSG